MDMRKQDYFVKSITKKYDECEEYTVTRLKTRFFDIVVMDGYNGNRMPRDVMVWIRGFHMSPLWEAHPIVDYAQKYAPKKRTSRELKYRLSLFKRQFPEFRAIFDD